MSVVELPELMVTLLLTFAVGFGLIVIVVLAVALQVLVVIVTEYVPGVETIIDAVVCPVFHEKVFPDEAVRVVL